MFCFSSGKYEDLCLLSIKCWNVLFFRPIDGDEDNEDEFDIFPVIGQCRALYPFEGMEENYRHLDSVKLD